MILRKPIVLILALAFIAGCDLGAQPTESFLSIEVSPISDRSGLLLLDEPDISVPLSIEIYNHMREDAHNVRIVPSNVNMRIVNVSAIGEQRITIPGTRSLHGSPGSAIIDAQVGVARQKRDYSSRIDYHVCADTRTVFESTICITPSGTRGVYDEGCDPQDKTFSERQGAPVAVASMRQADAVNSVSIMFDLVNYGNGIVFRQGTDTCSYIEQENAGVISLSELRIGDTQVDCTNEDTPTRRMGFDQQYQRYTGTTFRCSIDKHEVIADADAPVTRPIVAIFEYGYHTLAERQVVLVQGVPGYDREAPVSSVSSSAHYTLLTPAP